MASCLRVGANVLHVEIMAELAQGLRGSGWRTAGGGRPGALGVDRGVEL